MAVITLEGSNERLANITNLEQLRANYQYIETISVIYSWPYKVYSHNLYVLLFNEFQSSTSILMSSKSAPASVRRILIDSAFTLTSK